MRIRSPGRSVHVWPMNSTNSCAAEDQVAGVRVLAQLAVDPRAQAEVLGVGDLVGRGDPRADRAEGVGALGARPLGLAALEVAGGHVVGDAVARDRPSPPDHDRQLALVVQPPHDLRADGSGRRAARPSRATLTNTIGNSGFCPAGLLDVLGVVEPDPVDRRRIGDRREQRDLVERPRRRRRRGVAPGQDVATVSSAAKARTWSSCDLARPAPRRPGSETSRASTARRRRVRVAARGEDVGHGKAQAARLADQVQLEPARDAQGEGRDDDLVDSRRGGPRPRSPSAARRRRCCP